MASENETVASISDYIRHIADNITTGVILTIPQCNFIADRIVAAHNREVAELRECLKEAIDMTCENNGTCSDCPIFGEQHGDCNIYKWRKALEGANHEGK